MTKRSPPLLSGWLALAVAAATSGLTCGPQPAAAPTVTTPSTPAAAVPVFDPGRPDALPGPRSNAGWQAPAPVPLPPAPVPGATSLRGDAPAPPRPAATIRSELIPALQEHNKLLASKLLTEAAALGETAAATILYESLDGAHGKKFKNRRGRHAGLGSQEVSKRHYCAILY